MRNEKTWEEKVLPKAIQDFTLRIQQDLNKISRPDDLLKLGSYYIQGPVGSGKTIQAAFLCLEAKKRKYLEVTDREILFITVSEFLNMIKVSYSDPESDEQLILDRYSEAEFLVLDDFGPERSTDWAMALLYLLINRRYENLLDTVITSNLTLEELTTKLGDERIPARIERMCEIIEKTKF